MVSASTRRCLRWLPIHGRGFAGLHWSAAYGPNASCCGNSQGHRSMDRLSGGVQVCSPLTVCWRADLELNNLGEVDVQCRSDRK